MVDEFETLRKTNEQLQEKYKKRDQEAQQNADSLKQFMESHVDAERERKARISKIRHEIGAITINAVTRVRTVKLELDEQLQYNPDVQNSILNAIVQLDELKDELVNLLGGSNQKSKDGRVYMDGEIISS